MEGNSALGASFPAKPAFTKPEPLLHTKAVVSSSSHMSTDSGGGTLREVRCCVCTAGELSSTSHTGTQIHLSYSFGFL